MVISVAWLEEISSCDDVGDLVCGELVPDVHHALVRSQGLAHALLCEPVLGAQPFVGNGLDFLPFSMSLFSWCLEGLRLARSDVCCWTLLPVLS